MMFSLRIVNVDSYQSAPTKGYDICYSEFRGCEIFKVPIIRIFGITPAGQKGCLHVHGVFPYFSIRCKDVFPNIEAKSLRKYLQELALDIDKALNVASRSANSHRHHVYKIVITEQIPFYGFHEKAEEFLKIYFYNPFDISRTSELMTNGVILNKFIQPYEAHIPYILQFFIDYNLFGMNLINVSKFKFRASENDYISPISPLRNQTVSHASLDETTISSNKLWNFGALSNSQISSLPRQTVCELELDCCSSEIMNRLNESFSSGKNPGLLAIWEEERQRRKAENETSSLTPVPSQERADFFETESENFYKKKLRKILESFDMYKTGPKEKFESSLKDSKDDLPLSNASDLSTTQDEEMLNMMLSMVNSQSSHLDDDSILGLNHETENQSKSDDEETLEMSQLFTGELEEEIWSSQLDTKDTKSHIDVHPSAGSVSGQSVTSSAAVFIPQLDGAFDQEPHSKKNVKKLKRKVNVQNRDRAALTEASLIKSCQLMTPVVQLTPSVIIQKNVPSPVDSRLESNDNSQFLNEDSSSSSHKNPFQLLVPVSKNARCSLIMNIFEGSNDVNIEHTCENRNCTNNASLSESEDPSDVVFEVITNLIYKVECLTDSRNSCYEHLTEEYQGESYSKMLFQGLSAEERRAIYKLKESISRPCDRLATKKEFHNEANFSLPLKKRTYNYNWDRPEYGRCNSCNHSLSVDFSKIGKEVVVLRKLSESDFVKNVKLQELKVVIPPLSLPSSNSLLKTCVNSVKPPSPVASNSRNEKLNNTDMPKSKINNCDINEESPTNIIENVNELKNENLPIIAMENLTELKNGKLPENVIENENKLKNKKQPVIVIKDMTELKNGEMPKSVTENVNKLKKEKQPVIVIKNIPENVTVNVNDLKNEKLPVIVIENITELKNEKMPENITKNVNELKNNKMPENITEIVKELKSEKMPENMAENVKELKNEKVPENITENVKELKIEKLSLIVTRNVTELKNGKLPENVNKFKNKKLPVNAIENRTELKNEELPKNVIENMSELEHEKIPVNVTKNVTEFKKYELSENITENATKLTNDELVYDTGSHLRCSSIQNINEPSCTNTSVMHCLENGVKLNQSRSDLNILHKDNSDSDTQNKNLKLDKPVLAINISDLRLYRRRKSAAENVTQSQAGDVSMTSSRDKQNAFHSVQPITKNNMASDLQDTSVLKSPDPAPSFLPVVQLKPCNDLIDKYCKSDNSESDDCLIVAEFPQKCESLSKKKKLKRLSRSRVKLDESTVSDSNIVNKCAVVRKHKSNKITPKVYTPVNIVSNSNANIPALRKRSTSSDMPDKKKVGFISKSKLNLVNQKLRHNFESSFVNSFLEKDNSKTSLSENAASSITPVKKDVSCKLSLKLNKKKFNHSKNNTFSINHDVEEISSSPFKNDNYLPKSKNLFLAKKLKKYHSKEKKLKSFMSNINTAAASNLSVNWSIDDIPISQLRNSHALKCTISKKKQNGGKNLHVLTRSKPPIPKFKMKRKRGCEPLNLNIRLRKPHSSESDPDFIPDHHVSRKKQSSRMFLRNSQAFTSAHDIKQKYKKSKKYRTLHHNKSPDLKKKCLTVHLKRNSSESSFSNEKTDTTRELNSISISSYTSNSTLKNETSDISNLSPFADENSNDSRRSKNSLKLKLKLKRILTRSNEERIVVVGKELEGINEESSSEEESPKNNVLEPEPTVKPISFKKLLGTKNIKYQRDDFSLKAKFKCPFVETNKSSTANAQTRLQLVNKVPKIICKPLLTSKSKGLLPATINSSQNTPNSAVSENCLLNSVVISPKKQSPIKSAKSFNRELAELNKTLRGSDKPTEVNSVCVPSSKVLDPKISETDLPCDTSAVAPTNSTLLERKPSTGYRVLDSEENKINLSSDRSSASPTHSRLRVRKPSTGSKILVPEGNKTNLPTNRSNESSNHSRLRERKPSTDSKTLDPKDGKTNFPAYRSNMSPIHSKLRERKLSMDSKIIDSKDNKLNLPSDRRSVSPSQFRLHEQESSTFTKKILGSEYNETNLPSNRGSMSPTHFRLRERKPSTGSKIAPRRNSLKTQDFKKYFDSDEEKSVTSEELILKENTKCLLSDILFTYKPCKVELERLSPLEIDKYIQRPLFKPHNTEKILACEPSVLSVPSPIVDIKGSDPYVDPTKLLENLFNFPFACNSPLKYNKFESSPLRIENDKSLEPLSNDNSEYFKKATQNVSGSKNQVKRPCDVFKSVDREDMGILWNLGYLSPISEDSPLGSPPSCFSPTQGTIEDKNKSYEELDELQKLASKANKLCSESDLVKKVYSDVSYDSDHLPPYNWLESDAENSLSVMNESIPKVKNKIRCAKNSKTSFQNILQENEHSDNLLQFDHQKSSDISKPSTSSDANDCKNSEELKSASSEEAGSEGAKEESCKGEEPMFEPIDPLPNVRILDFQECLIESDSEMNPLLNDSEIESVINSADLMISDSINAFNYDPCIQTDLSFENSTLSLQTKPKCAPEEPKNAVDDVFINASIDTSFQKTLETDLSNNNAIITAADTSSLLISSFKNNSIPVLAVNNPCQDESATLTTLNDQSVNINNQFFPIVLAPIPIADNANYLENSAAKESQDCVNFLEDTELLQSCSVSSTSDIENRSAQASNVLGIPFNGEEDILSMIVKSCDIGEEFDMNMNSVDEMDCDGISSVIVDNSLIESNYILTEPEFVPDKNHSFNANSENAVSSSSEKNLSQKQSSEIVMIKTEPVDVLDVREFPNKCHFNCTDKNLKSLEELGKDDSVLLDSMIQSFYGDDSLYGLNSSASCDNLSLICPTFQGSILSQDMQKLAAECSLPSTKSCIKVEDVPFEGSSFMSENFPRILPELLSKRLSEKEQFQPRSYNNKVPLDIQNSLFVSKPFQKSSKRFCFTPTFKPPTRDFVENSVFKIELEGKVDEDSISSDSSISSQACVKDISLPNVFNKTSLHNDEYLDSQKSYILSKNSPHLDSKPLLSNSPVFYKGSFSKLQFNEHLISTPSTSNIKKGFPLPDVVISPINKESVLLADTSKRKRKLVFEDDLRGPIKILKPEREMLTVLNKYRGNQSLDSLGNLSYSQIEGPTLENSRGFKVGSDNYGDAHVRHEIQHLTVMSLEIHVNTRSDLRPDPKFDAVTAIFYCIYNDIGVNEEEEIVGMIVVDPSSHQTSGQNSSDILRNYLLLCPGVKNGFIYCVENEMSLFEKLINVIKEWDPDILVGYEIQMHSWGYLVERAEFLNINLRVLISRLVDKNEMKIVPIEPDHTVTDQTADLSRLNITGRIVLCVWRLMRKEITLNIYTFENVYYHVLHKRTPLYTFHDLTRWFLGSQKEKVIRYYVIRVQGCIHLLEKLDIIGRTSELARLFGIQFYEVLSRGSQFRVESMMLRTAAPMSYIPVSPSVRQRSHSRAPECVPLVLEPESRFYIDPVVVLDFQSLYPSMIIAYNYCFSTCLGRVEHFGKNVPFEFGCTSLSIPVALLQKLQNDIHISPTGIAFTNSSVRRGILPSMLEEILSTRVMVKQSMKKIKQNSALKKLLDARQMGLKLIANVTYGYTGATFSGRMPNVEVADSIVGKARETLERAIHMIENTSKWRAKVVYGDTDSLFILLPGRSKKQAFEIGQEIADAVTADNPKPVKLKFEKVYLPCVLQTKKRYVGFMFETVDQEKPVFDAKGIETVRRDSCPATAKILEKSLKLLFNSYDVSSVKNYVQKQFSKLLSGRASIIDCIFAKEYRGISGYRPGACVPALEIAKKRLAKDPRSEPRVGERVPYVVVYGFPGLPIIQLVREPIDLLKDINLRINASYYITRVISPPLERVFNLLNADVKSWYTTLARTIKPTLPMTRTANQHRGTLSQYFASLSCPSCEKPTFSTICEDCREDLQGTTVTLNEKIRKWERTVDHVTQICGSCTKSGSSIEHCVSVDCPMLYRLNAAKKDLSQAPHLRKLLAHELF